MSQRRFGSSCAWRTSPRGPPGQQGTAAGGAKGKRKTQDSAARERAWSHSGVSFLTSPGGNSGVGVLEKAGFPGSHASVMPRAPRRRPSRTAARVHSGGRARQARSLFPETLAPGGWDSGRTILTAPTLGDGSGSPHISK